MVRRISGNSSLYSESDSQRYDSFGRLENESGNPPESLVDTIPMYSISDNLPMSSGNDESAMDLISLGVLFREAGIYISITLPPSHSIKSSLQHPSGGMSGNPRESISQSVMNDDVESSDWSERSVTLLLLEVGRIKNIDKRF